MAPYNRLIVTLARTGRRWQKSCARLPATGTNGATTEEEVDEDGDLEGAFELPGRPVSLRNEHHVEDESV